MTEFWTRGRWRASVLVASLAGLGYVCQVWADLTTHPDSRTYRTIALVLRAVFYAAALVGLILVLRPKDGRTNQG